MQDEASQHVQVTAEHGDTAPVISCRADGSPAPSLVWSQDGDAALPEGLTTSSSGAALMWDRPLSYTDSGRYLCTSTNQLGQSTATLELLVRSKYTLHVELVTAEYIATLYGMWNGI